MDTLNNLRLSLAVGLALAVEYLAQIPARLGRRLAKRDFEMLELDRDTILARCDELWRDNLFLKDSIRQVTVGRADARQKALKLLNAPGRAPQYRLDEARLIVALTERPSDNRQFGIVCPFARWGADTYWITPEKKACALLAA